MRVSVHDCVHVTVSAVVLGYAYADAYLDSVWLRVYWNGYEFMCEVSVGEMVA